MVTIDYNKGITLKYTYKVDGVRIVIASYRFPFAETALDRHPIYLDRSLIGKKQAFQCIPTRSIIRW